jgi:hypothetical protein
LATRLGCRNGSSTTPAPIAIRSVRAAKVESATVRSTIGLWNDRCSPAQIES